MRAEGSATSVVAALSVVVAVVGHVLAGGGPVPLAMVAPLLALIAVCWVLGEYLADEPLLSALVLAGVQLFVHVSLDGSHHHMAGHRGISGSLTMTAAHLMVLVVGVLLISRTHRWVQRVTRIFARLLPQLPVLIPVRRYVVVPAAVPAEPRLVQRWLSSNVSRRGPPMSRVIPVPS